MIPPIEPRPHIEAVEPPSGADVIALPSGPSWWRTTISELQERGAEERRHSRELRLELDAAGVELHRAQARAAIHEREMQALAAREATLRKVGAQRDARLAGLEQELRVVRAERRALLARNERAIRQLSAIQQSRVYRLVALSWRVRHALSRPFRRD
jgi:hypothetical protein